jgi:zinc transport system ATP-binding protein
MTSIIFNEVSFGYGSSSLLEKASFSISEKEFIGIFGPNGAGKTTLLQLMMGFLKPHSGEISILGMPPLEARSNIAYVPQTAHFDRQFPVTVQDIVMMGCIHESRWWGALPSSCEQKVHEALHLVDLCGKRNTSFGSLSGGEVQRVLIAKALVSNPKILLLDEPTANIDAATEHALYHLLKELKKDKTIVMVSHQLPAMTHCVDKCLLVDKGVQTLFPDELCDHYAVGLYHLPLSRGSFTHAP